jgi:hypothetical protein
MRWFAAILVLLIGILADAAMTSAAEIDCVFEGDIPGVSMEVFHKLQLSDPLQGKCVWAELRGQIVRGDYDKLHTMMTKSWPLLTLLDLHSPGGSAAEALRIGRLIRRYLITTNAPGHGRCNILNSETGCDCASACALIWFGGIQRIGKVGLHRPRIDDPDFASSPPDEAMALYRRVLAAIESYLVEMEAPRSVIDAMLATSSSEIRWVDAVTDQLSRPPSYAEWEDASCKDTYDPWRGPLIDECRGPLRTSRVKELSPP